MEKNTSMIYIIKHKEYNNPIPNNYKELYVGNLFEFKKDNINELNPYINEATGLYDIWKNTKEKIVGLCHYRRFFWNNGDYLKLADAKQILKDYDIIMTNNVVFDKGIYEQLRLEMPNDNERLILDKYYAKLCEKEPKLEQFFKEKEFAPKEMFVCNRNLLNEYCEWLFDLIIPITKEFIENDSNIIQKRMIGHLTERLFYYYMKDKKIYRMEIRDI